MPVNLQRIASGMQALSPQPFSSWRTLRGLCFLSAPMVGSIALDYGKFQVEIRLYLTERLVCKLHGPILTAGAVDDRARPFLGGDSSPREQPLEFRPDRSLGAVHVRSGVEFRRQRIVQGVLMTFSTRYMERFCESTVPGTESEVDC
ncbi:hypothetical protein GGS26DRAFT_595473 [Hypomontagnella submonticulosa]|nr:hypothetical protein GGS26DRAFT_595473 [Hypomontagnella submonticulosa]